jgi:hypothetical protein
VRSQRGSGRVLRLLPTVELLISRNTHPHTHTSILDILSSNRLNGIFKALHVSSRLLLLNLGPSCMSRWLLEPRTAPKSVIYDPLPLCDTWLVFEKDGTHYTICGLCFAVHSHRSRFSGLTLWHTGLATSPFSQSSRSAEDT